MFFLLSNCSEADNNRPGSTKYQEPETSPNEGKSRAHKFVQFKVVTQSVEIFLKKRLHKRFEKTILNLLSIWLVRPALGVMGGESCSEGRGLKSQHHILDGHFFTYIYC